MDQVPAARWISRRAPLKTYRRSEPDFIVIHNHVAIVVEVDCDTVPRELPTEADERLRMMTFEGVEALRISTTECETAEKAEGKAGEILAFVAKRRR